MSNEKTRKIVTITGKTGRGKSHLTEHYIVKNLSREMPVLIADCMAEYDSGIKFTGFDRFYEYVKSKGLENGIYSVSITSDVEAKKLFVFSRYCGVQHCLAVEEASKYCSPHKIDNVLNELVSYGRHWGVSLIFSAQRFAQLNKIVTSQTDMFITFQQTEKNDLKAISDFFNDTDKIMNLNKREFVAFGDDSGIGEIITNEVLTLNKSKIQKV